MKSKLEQLAAYLPFKLICLVDGFEAELNAVYCDGTGVYFGIVESSQGFETIKPILTPLEQVNWNKINVENHLHFADKIAEFIEYFEYGKDPIDVAVFAAPYPVFRWLLSQHYDVFGLLKTGEAVLK